MNIDLDTLTLAKGAHDLRDDGVCLMEAVAWWAGEEHTDHPACVSPVLGAYGRSLNDILPDAKRQELLEFVPLLPGTAGDGHDETRSYLALDWIIRVWTPTWLELAGLAGEARALRQLRPVVDMTAAQSAGPAVRQASQAAAGDTAWAVGGAAARAAAAWDAAGDAARAAAWDADAAGDADAAWAAAWDAAWAAAWAAAARKALAPTVATLQNSAITLYQAMITAGGQQA